MVFFHDASSSIGHKNIGSYFPHVPSHASSSFFLQRLYSAHLVSPVTHHISHITLPQYYDSHITPSQVCFMPKIRYGNLK